MADKKKVSAKQAAIQILRRAKRPMQVQELITKVLETPGVELKGKTPRATVAAQLYTGKEFKKAGRGIVELAAKQKPKPEAKAKPRLTRHPAKEAAKKPKPVEKKEPQT